MSKFKIGDIVRCIKTHDGKKLALNKIGKIIKVIEKELYLVEFFENINGHDGSEGIGKKGHCWHIDGNKLKFHNPILKKFIEEMEGKNNS